MESPLPAAISTAGVGAGACVPFSVVAEYIFGKYQ
jgi:hypothetical protein